MRRPALIALLCVVGVLASTATATARPPSTYRNWAQTKANSAGVVYHPYGDKWEVWYNVNSDSPAVVAVEYNYKGVADKWKTIIREIVIGRTYFKVRANVKERKHIFFRIYSPSRSSISEYRTT